MTAPFGLLRTRRRGRKLHPLAKIGSPLDGCSDFWEPRVCHSIEIPGFVPDSTARHWRASLLLGVGFLPERLRRRENQFARRASLCENLVAFKRADTRTCGVAARCWSSRCRKVSIAGRRWPCSQSDVTVHTRRWKLSMTKPLLFCALLTACPSVRQADLDARAGQPVSALEKHPVFLTMPVVRTVTSDGTEIRNYINGRNVARCSGGGNVFASSVDFATYSTLLPMYASFCRL